MVISPVWGRTQVFFWHFRYLIISVFLTQKVSAWWECATVECFHGFGISFFVFVYHLGCMCSLDFSFPQLILFILMDCLCLKLCSGEG